MRMSIETATPTGEVRVYRLNMYIYYMFVKIPNKLVFFCAMFYCKKSYICHSKYFFKRARRERKIAARVEKEMIFRVNVQLPACDRTIYIYAVISWQQCISFVNNIPPGSYLQPLIYIHR